MSQVNKILALWALSGRMAVSYKYFSRGPWMIHIFLDPPWDKITNITPCDDNAKAGALCISIQGNLEDFSGALIFCEIKLSLGEISWVMESFYCCPQFFQRFRSMESHREKQTWESFLTHHHHHHHHHPFFATELQSPKVLVYYHPLCPLHCPIPQIAHFLTLTAHMRIEFSTLTLSAMCLNEHGAGPK